MRLFVCAGFLMLVPTGVVWAYVGPGPGITLIGSLVAVVGAIVLALGGILLWPVRSLLRRRHAAAQGSEEVRAQEGAAEPDIAESAGADSTISTRQDT